MSVIHLNGSCLQTCMSLDHCVYSQCTLFHVKPCKVLLNSIQPTTSEKLSTDSYGVYEGQIPGRMYVLMYLYAGLFLVLVCTCFISNYWMRNSTTGSMACVTHADLFSVVSLTIKRIIVLLKCPRTVVKACANQVPNL